MRRISIPCAVLLVVLVACRDGGQVTSSAAIASPAASETASASPHAASASVTPGQPAEADIEAGKRARQAATADLSKALCKDTSDCPPPAPRSRFIDERGFFRLPQWDDRNLTEEDKARDPRRDPFWPAFVQCLQEAGVGVGLTTPDDATQADINRLVEEVNKSGPAYLPTSKGLQFQSTLASEAFLRCETILYDQRPTGISGPRRASIKVRVKRDGPTGRLSLRIAPHTTITR